MAEPSRVPWSDYRPLPEPEMQRRAADLLKEMRRRRSVRDFSSRKVPREIIEDCIRTAGTAPSGANRQPWRFVVVEDPAVKRRIRQAAERTEADFYERRASKQWLGDLAPLGTGPGKPFLEDAPYLIVVFVRRWEDGPDGGKVANYYPTESTAIATGLLIAALHHAGLATLPYTPNPMRFLGEILGRPESDRPMLILVTGYPAEGVTVPQIEKKSLGQIATFV